MINNSSFCLEAFDAQQRDSPWMDIQWNTTIRNHKNGGWSTLVQTLKYLVVQCHIYRSILLCFNPSTSKCFLFFRNMSIKALIIQVPLPSDPPLYGHKKMHVCRNTPTKTNLWRKVLIPKELFKLFPPASLTHCAFPCTLYPDLFRLQEMQAEWKLRDKFTAVIWVNSSKH